MKSSFAAQPLITKSSQLTLDDALIKRRSVREFESTPLTRQELVHLCWSLQGITDDAGHRTTPSAGALFPLETYVATQDGLYHYQPARHQLTQTAIVDLRADLAAACWSQEFLFQSPAVFVIAAAFRKTTSKYGIFRGQRYVWIECGHAAQNLLLEATSLNLGAVPVGAFDDKAVDAVLGLGEQEHVLYLIPVGHARSCSVD